MCRVVFTMLYFNCTGTFIVLSMETGKLFVLTVEPGHFIVLQFQLCVYYHFERYSEDREICVGVPLLCPLLLHTLVV